MNKRFVILRALVMAGLAFAFAGCFESGPDYYAGYPDHYYSEHYYGGPGYYAGPTYNVYPEYGYYQPQPWYRRWSGGRGSARAENREHEAAESRNFVEHRPAFERHEVERHAQAPRAENNRATTSREGNHGSERWTGRD